MSPAYRRTFFDRLGPDAPALVRSVVFALTMSPLGAVGGAALGAKLGLEKSTVVLMAIVGAFLAAALIFFVIRVIPYASGAAMQATLMPSGNTTPYETDYSYEMALVIKGDVKGALDSFEEEIAASPVDSSVRLKAAETYVTQGNYSRARDLYREVQRIPGVERRDDVFASYRLIDLYRERLMEPGKSLPEFRRLIERYPSSQIETQAREALAKLKGEMSFDQ
ncbi:MAG: hypothetical protein H0U64_04520 [Gemmatimonadaceae bacterium]|nr:hypothetical protein [Gemmatimonadaceae bacterium]